MLHPVSQFPRQQLPSLALRLRSTERSAGRGFLMPKLPRECCHGTRSDSRESVSGPQSAGRGLDLDRQPVRRRRLGEGRSFCRGLGAGAQGVRRGPSAELPPGPVAALQQVTIGFSGRVRGVGPSSDANSHPPLFLAVIQRPDFGTKKRAPGDAESSIGRTLAGSAEEDRSASPEVRTPRGVLAPLVAGDGRHSRRPSPPVHRSGPVSNSHLVGLSHVRRTAVHERRSQARCGFFMGGSEHALAGCLPPLARRLWPSRLFELAAGLAAPAGERQSTFTAKLHAGLRFGSTVAGFGQALTLSPEPTG